MNNDETIDIPDVTAEQARSALAVKLLLAGFESYGSGTFWELDGQTIAVLLTEKHTDVFFFGNQTLRMQYDSPQLLLGDWDVLMGIDPDDIEAAAISINEVVEEPDEPVPNYQQANDPGPLTTKQEPRSGF